MPIEVIITTGRIQDDAIGRSLVNFLQENSHQLNLGDALLYYDFPTYADYETVTHKPDALLVSPNHGVVAIRVVRPIDLGVIARIDESLGQFSSILIGRLLKSRLLRQTRASLAFNVTPLVFAPAQSLPVSTHVDAEVATSTDGLSAVLHSLEAAAFGQDALAEIRSVIEGAKALTRPQKREIANPEAQACAAALAKLEAEIANFDYHQRRAAITAIVPRSDEAAITIVSSRPFRRLEKISCRSRSGCRIHSQST